MAGPYCIGIDVGTSRVAAAIATMRSDGAAETVHVPLGDRHDNAPAVALLTAEGELLLGDEAHRRGLTEPEHLITEFRRGVGDEVPFMIADNEVSAEQVFAQTVTRAIAPITQRKGSGAEIVTLTHPPAWGPHRTSLVQRATAELGFNVELISEPEALARHFDARHHWQPGQVVIAFDLGGTGFEAAALRKQPGGFAVVGEPISIDDLGGANFDDAIFRHVLASAGLTAADLTGADARAALAQLRRECVDAKEALSVDTDVTIPVNLPGNRSTVRLTRAEFEAMVEPTLDRTVDAVEELLEDAHLAITDVAAILLTGGSSRIPRVAQRLSEAFDRPIVSDPDPKASVAMGAATAALALFSERAAATGAELALPGEGQDAGQLQPLSDAGRAELVAAGFAVEESARPTRWRPWLTHAAVAVTGAAVVLVGGWLGGFTLAAGPASVSQTEAGTESTTSAATTEEVRAGQKATQEATDDPEEAAAALDARPAARPGIPADDRPSSSARPGAPRATTAAAAVAVPRTTTAGATTNRTTVTNNPAPAATRAQTQQPPTNPPAQPTQQQTQPAPQPAPVQDPVPDPVPDPIPDPVPPPPEPEPAPEPAPAPDPEPAPVTISSVPVPEPDPVPPADPEPTYEPEPTFETSEVPV